MKITLNHENTNYSIDLKRPIDISIPSGQVKCFYATDYMSSPYVSGDFIGSVKAGAPVNFYDLQLNPHGNGTHTECLGHITEEHESLQDTMNQFHFVAYLASVSLDSHKQGDKIITLERLQSACPSQLPEALIIRTLPNTQEKLHTDYSGSNPPYLDHDAMTYLVNQGVRHILIDLPSVDREIDDGLLKSHHIFWNVDNKKAIDDSRIDCTITELIYVPEDIADGLYFLNIQVPNIPLDAAPSKPLLYNMDIIEESKSH